MKKKKVKKLTKGFYMNRKTGHPSLPFWQRDKQVKSIGFTHNEKDFVPKRKMKYNINSQDNSPCFVKTTIEEYKYNDYREDKRFCYYRVHPDDNDLITEIKKDGKKPSLRKKHTRWH